VTRASRYDRLDSMRGFAATMVVLGHCFVAMEDKTQGFNWWLANTPLRILVSGRPAVILFFVLSGFVLAVSLERATSYRDFLIRRFCRIYLPFAASILLALAVHLAVSREALPGYSGWFNNVEALSVELFVNHLLMLGDYANVSLNRVMWSLVYELRISLMFPLLMWLTYRYATWNVLAACLLPAAASYVALLELGYGPREFHYATSTAAGFWLTVHFAVYFVIGAAVAKHRHELVARAREIAPVKRFGIAAMSGALLLPLSFAVPDLPLGALSAILIVLVLAGGSMTASVFDSAPALFIGRVSYSLYLFHLPAYFLVAHAWPGGAMPLAYIWLVWPPLAVAAAAIGYRLIEKPSQELGRELVARLNGKPAAA
jgi:peptidoglycan/LPS O-acetylase OafA/YrhL